MTPEDREDVMFFGALGREVSSIRRDLFERAEEDWDASMPMQGGRVFHATLFRSQPILWIFTLHAGLVLSEFCIGAANEQVILGFPFRGLSWKGLGGPPLPHQHGVHPLSPPQCPQLVRLNVRPSPWLCLEFVPVGVGWC